MDHHPHPAAPAAPSFHVTVWDARRPLASGDLGELVADAQVIGVGESAHFVAELSAVRASLVEALVREVGVDHVALEIGHDEAQLVEQWLAGRRAEPLTTLVGPLTAALYGSFLGDLRRRLPGGHAIRVLGVDLPNSLTIAPSLAPLATLLRGLDPAATELVDETSALAARVVGASAAASATSWLALDERVQDALTVHLVRLRARVDALAAVHAHGPDAPRWRDASRFADAAATTDVMLRAMADLFSGTGRVDDTTIREAFVARRLTEAVASLGPEQHIAYVAHDNHVQKAPVVFDGVVAAHPAGSLLAASLGARYVAIALAHADDEVPEMAVPASTSVGFRVERVPAAPVGGDGVEGACARVLRSIDAAVVRWDEGGGALRIRSQSAATEVQAWAFDAAIVVSSAATDSMVRELGLD